MKGLAGKLSHMEKIWMDKLMGMGLNDLETRQFIEHCQSIKESYEDNVVDFAESFIAPAYISYASWILKDAQRRGLKKLYFLNRDCYIIWKIAEVLNDGKIELEYLFLSRRVLSVPFLRNGDVNRLRLISGLSGEYYVWKIKDEDIAFRLNMTKKELAEEYSLKCGSAYGGSVAEVDKFVEDIFACAPLMKKIKEEGDVQFHLLKTYLHQSGILDSSETCGIVEIGWTGTSRAMLTTLLNEMGICNPPLWYYFGADDQSLPVKYGQYVSFSGSKYKSEPIVPLLENYFSLCPYGSVRSFELSSEGKVTPILSKKPAAKQVDIMETNIKVCEAIAKVFKELKISDKVAKEWCDISLYALGNYICKDIDYSVLINGKNYEGKPLVRQLRMKDIIRLCTIVPSDMDVLNVFYSFSFSTSKNFLKYRKKIYKIIWLVKHYIHF